MDEPQPLDDRALAALDFTTYLETLRACRRCPGVQPPPVVGAVAAARILLIGQAPGPRERDEGRPFAWTAGTTLFRWLASIGAEEDSFRQRVYMGAVIRCFPGKNAKGQGDRAPSRSEVATCRPYYRAELRRLRPALVLPVGRMAIAEFVPHARLDEVVGRAFPIEAAEHACTAIPLPHPSGLSAWHKTEPGKTLLARALELIVAQPVWRETFPAKAG
ncbi:MAG TPA: uracil-DNA glycosylase family protein [bacterium]|nr:uracil-DNA glycosylase family protein [bacterium]